MNFMQDDFASQSRSVPLVDVLFIFSFAVVLMPYPSLFFACLFGNEASIYQNSFYDLILKDLATSCLAGLIILRLITQERLAATPLILISLLYGPGIFITMTSKMDDPKQILFGLRTISHHFVPCLAGALIAPGMIARTQRALWFIAYVSIGACLVHAAFLFLGIGISPYRSGVTSSYRTIGLIGEPNSMSFIASTVAIFAVSQKKRLLALIAIGVAISSFSLTGLIPLGIFCFLQIRRSKLAASAAAATLILAAWQIFPRIAGILSRSDPSTTGKLIAYKNTWNVFIDGSPSQIFFGRGMSNYDAVGHYLSVRSENAAYFPVESTYNLFLLQNGVLGLSLYLAINLWAIGNFLNRKDEYSRIAMLFLSAILLSNLGLLYFSIYSVATVQAFLIGQAFNRRFRPERLPMPHLKMPRDAVNTAGRCAV